MKIAVPTNDGATISEHFGRSTAFLIFETENGQIKSRELKNDGTSHSQVLGACNHGSADHQPHSHAGLLVTLDGCQVAICAGMGQRAADALKGCGMQIFVTSLRLAEEAVSAYCAGKLTPQAETFCPCSHSKKQPAP